ncbi:HNH endonuclease [Flagellimonas taeanensis]|uniref:HNH endonuclease n=1 Tax=Flagellimonas taeanensis TaxID=1005926 RepID=UPI0015A537AC|nr:HNH endonuclease [Allomuricauda taeanensis]
MNLDSTQIRDDKQYWIDKDEYYKSLNGKFMTLRLIEQVSNEQMRFENLKKYGLKAAPQGPIRIKNERLLNHIETYFTDNYQIDFFPDILKEDQIEYEGAKKLVLVNRYERSSKARENAIRYHGLNCKVCDLNFKKVYGKIGEGFIHIHHLIPINEIGESYKIDFENDLIPVCPNCHAMLHRKLNGKEPTVYELKQILKKKNT